MSRFVSKQPVRVTIEGSEDYVDIKPKLSRGDRDRLTDLILEVKQVKDEKGKDNPEVELKGTLRYDTAILKVAVVGWNLKEKDEDTAPMPLTPAAIEELSSDDPLISKVLEEIARLNPTSAKVEKSG